MFFILSTVLLAVSWLTFELARMAVSQEKANKQHETYRFNFRIIITPYFSVRTLSRIREAYEPRDVGSLAVGIDRNNIVKVIRGRCIEHAHP